MGKDRKLLRGSGSLRKMKNSKHLCGPEPDLLTPEKLKTTSSLNLEAWLYSRSHESEPPEHFIPEVSSVTPAHLTVVHVALKW